MQSDLDTIKKTIQAGADLLEPLEPQQQMTVLVHLLACCISCWARPGRREMAANLACLQLREMLSVGAGGRLQ